MRIVVAIFNANAALAVEAGIVVAYVGYRVIHGFRVYFRFRGARLVTCPDTHQVAGVELAARSMCIQAILVQPCLRINRCSRWPMLEGCGEDCLRQIEVRPSEVKIPTLWKAW
jgi:hypothetical protein